MNDTKRELERERERERMCCVALTQYIDVGCSLFAFYSFGRYFNKLQIAKNECEMNVANCTRGLKGILYKTLQ